VSTDMRVSHSTAREVLVVQVASRRRRRLVIATPGRIPELVGSQRHVPERLYKSANLRVRSGPCVHPMGAAGPMRAEGAQHAF